MHCNVSPLGEGFPKVADLFCQSKVLIITTEDPKLATSQVSCHQIALDKWTDLDSTSKIFSEVV